jgi:hypothetical protein
VSGSGASWRQVSSKLADGGWRADGAETRQECVAATTLFSAVEEQQPRNQSACNRRVARNLLKDVGTGGALGGFGLLTLCTGHDQNASKAKQRGDQAGLKGVYNGLDGGEDAPVVRARGGIGRREGLRILWRNPCRFDPCRAHTRIFLLATEARGGMDGSFFETDGLMVHL